MINYKQITSMIMSGLLNTAHEEDSGKRAEKYAELASFLIRFLAAVAYTSLTKEGVDTFGDEIKKTYFEEVDRMEKESLIIEKAVTNATEH